MRTETGGNTPRPAGLLEAMRAFLATESAGGMVLVAMMVLALAWANSPFAPLYDRILAVPVVAGVGGLVIDKPLLLWINDGLMAVFFLLVALEIKREMLEGELSSAGQVLLPAGAALGGMAVPALVYLFFSGGDPVAWRGWAIPSATDIAFSLGVLALLGRSVPVGLRVFLAALAIIDDLGAIVIIALFYTGELSALFLSLAGAGILALWGLNRAGVVRFAPYALAGVFVWVCLLKSGVHATLAGVVLGLAVPMAGLGRLERALHPWVAFAILPLFALANAGLSFAGMKGDALVHPVFLGVALGLFLGKQVGVFGLSWLLVRLRLARLPEGAGWGQLYGVAVLTGIGFTMSLFIGGLAFPGGDMAETRTGVLAGSLASAVFGWTVLALIGRRSAARREDEARHTLTPAE